MIAEELVFYAHNAWTSAMIIEQIQIDVHIHMYYKPVERIPVTKKFKITVEELLNDIDRHNRRNFRGQHGISSCYVLVPQRTATQANRTFQKELNEHAIK